MAIRAGAAFSRPPGGGGPPYPFDTPTPISVVFAVRPVVKQTHETTSGEQGLEYAGEVGDELSEREWWGHIVWVEADFGVHDDSGLDGEASTQGLGLTDSGHSDDDQERDYDEAWHCRLDQAAGFGAPSGFCGAQERGSRRSATDSCREQGEAGSYQQEE